MAFTYAFATRITHKSHIPITYAISHMTDMLMLYYIAMCATHIPYICLPYYDCAGPPHSTHIWLPYNTDVITSPIPQLTPT
jgi:hypothetical protein